MQASILTAFYLLLAAILYIAAFPFLLLLTFKQKYKHSIPKRFFLYKNPPFQDSGIWFHVCSYGEAVSLKPLLQKLEKRVNISVITQTGFQAAQRYRADVRYLPYELFLPFWIKKQKVLIVSEAELWYMLFWSAKKKGAKTILINARISDNSYRSYQRFRWFYQKIFAHIDTVFAQSERDKQRLLELGAKKVEVTGNIKAYANVKTTRTFKKPQQEVVTLASTHAGEEALLLENIDYHDKKLIVVPRHPERFMEVGELLSNFAAKKGLSFHKFSKKEDFDSDIILIDKMGELVNIYAISDIVYLGGSFVEGIGGHNPLEPASFGCKIISGMHIFNQLSLFDLVENINVIEPWEIAVTEKEAQSTKIRAKVEIEPIIKAINDVV